MKWNKLVLSGLVCVAMASPALAWCPRVGIGIGIGIPVYPGPYYYRPYYGYPYYYPAPVVVAPAPVVVQPAPTVLVPATSVAGSTQTAAPPLAPVASGPQPNGPQPNPTVTAFPPTELKKPADIGQLFQTLNDPDDKTRSDAVIQLGRLKLDQAVDPLCATLAGDKSAAVRDSAAKALGMIGATRALTALLHAAQADADNDVRHSAQFAVDIIKLNNNQK